MRAAGNENNIDEDVNANNITITIKNTKLYVLVATLLKRLSKEFERSAYWNEYKSKSEKKNMINEFRYFLKSNLVGDNRLFALVYPSRNNDSKKFKSKRYYYQKA